MNTKPFPRGAEKAQLWARIQSEAPQLAKTLNEFAALYPGSKAVSFDFDGTRYYDPSNPPPDPDKVFVIDESFLMRLPAAERQKYYETVNPKSAYDRAVAAKQTTKGKRR